MRVLVIGGGWPRARAVPRAVAGSRGHGAVLRARETRASRRSRRAAAADRLRSTSRARCRSADLVVVGPEAPLVAGVADDLRAAGFAVFGPSAAAAQLEGSKAFAKQVMADAGVPTAGHWVATHAERGRGGARRARAAVRRQARRARRRQGRRRHRRPRRGASARRRPPGRDRGVPRRPRGVAVLPHRRRRPSCRWSRRRTSSGSATTTRVRTPAGWAPTRRCRGRRPTWSTRSSSASCGRRSREMARRGTPFSGLLYVGLALTSRGIRGRGVQRPLRRPGDAGGARAARDAARRAAARGRRPARWRDHPPLRGATAPRSPSWSPRPGYPATRGPATRSPDSTTIDGASMCCTPARAYDGDRLVTSGGRVLSVTAVGSRPRGCERIGVRRGRSTIRIDGCALPTDIAAKPRERSGGADRAAREESR